MLHGQQVELAIANIGAVGTWRFAKLHLHHFRRYSTVVIIFTMLGQKHWHDWPITLRNYINSRLTTPPPYLQTSWLNKKPLDSVQCLRSLRTISPSYPEPRCLNRAAAARGQGRVKNSLSCIIYCVCAVHHFIRTPEQCQVATGIFIFLDSWFRGLVMLAQIKSFSSL